MKIRDRLPLLAVLCCFSALLLLPEVSAQAARDAMLLCAQTLIPSLFPFFVLSSLLIACGASELLSALLSPLMRPLFGLSGTGAAALALGLCGGYPVGARTAAELVENGALSQEEGERLLAFCNNAGPGFLLGVCGAGVFSSSRAGAALYLIHVAAALCAGLLTCRALPPVPHGTYPHKSAKAQHLSTAFPAAVQNALTGCLNVSAFVVFFTVLARLLLAPLRAAAWIFRAHERRAVASLLARGFSFLCGAARLGRDERPLSNAQHARGLSPLRAVLSQGKGAASAAVAAPCPARAAVSVSLTLTALFPR